MRRKKPVSPPPSQGTLASQKSIDAMTPEEGVIWMQGMRARLANKQQRERAYLDRRAKRNVHTPTDDAYEADQVLETELLALLDGLIERLAQEVDP